MCKVKYIFCFIAITLVLGMVSSCSKNNDSPTTFTTNKTSLKAAIDSLTIVFNTTKDGTKPGQYVVGARAALDTAILLATQVNASNAFTQQEVNNALSNLMKAAAVFNTKLLQEVSVANLVAFWKFNGNAIDSSGNGHNGTLTTGYIGSSATTAIDGATMPVLVADRFGRANMAYDFNNGATIEVPYSAALNPQNFTISLWIKRHTTNSGNYMISLNRWNGFKFQLQSNNFLFMTFQDGNNGYHDVDDNPGVIPQDVWTQGVVSYTNGTMKFYINGALVKTASVNGVPITVSPAVNLAIGNELPKSYYNLVNSNNPNYYWGANFFVGSLDDIRFYNTVLTDAEVLSIYTNESTL